MESFMNDWGISLAMFLPMAVALVMMLIPKDEEELHKLLALRPRWGRGRSAWLMAATLIGPHQGPAIRGRQERGFDV